MNNHEGWQIEGQPPQEDLDPRHFYAAYVFDQPETHKHDVITLVEEARRLGYPVRYWWLSDAMDIQDNPDRLIVCTHHPASDENAGMDLYNALHEHRVSWDELDSATVEEYAQLSRSITGPAGIRWPNGTPLFPLDLGQEMLAPPALSPASNTESTPKEYVVYYSLSSATHTLAPNTEGASENVFAALHALVGRVGVQGLTAKEANSLGLAEAEVEIDGVEGEGATKERAVELPKPDAEALFTITRADVQSVAREELGRELTDGELEAVMDNARKVLNWEFVVANSIQACQDWGRVGPAAEGYEREKEESDQDQ